MVGMIFDNIVVNARPLTMSFRTGFHIDISHHCSPQS
jgi:hypothetical protein